MIVVASLAQAEALLDAGKLRCPGCSGALRPHGCARLRRVRSLGAAPVTVRRWLRRAREPHPDWLHEQGVQHA